MVCDATNCRSEAVSKGLCNRHYQIAWKAANPDYQRRWRDANRDKIDAYNAARRVPENQLQRRRGRKCSVEGCDKPHEAKGLCLRHYRQTPEYKARRNVRHREYAKERYEKRLAAGLCSRCGKEPLFNWSECFDCSGDRAVRAAERKYG